MKTITLTIDGRRDVLYTRASALAAFTIFYNVLEGLISVYFGLEDETVSLFGFGLDSFVEVISGIGIWHMIRRVRRHGSENPDRFEKRALIITGASFYLLAFGLAVTAVMNLVAGHAPETTVWGIIIALVSIVSMAFLLHYKIKVGRELGSRAIIADAHCTRACMLLSIALLVASAGYELTGYGGLDSIGAVAIAAFSFREGREAIEKARNEGVCSCSSCCD